MPSVHFLRLFLATLLPVCALGGPVPIQGEPESGDTSGDELQDVVDHRKWHSIARLLQRDIARLRDEQFKRDFGETGMNMMDFGNKRIQTPLLNMSDGCLSKNFREQMCLQRMNAGLKTYRLYLPYVKKENLNAKLMDDVNVHVSRLLHILKERGSDDEDPQISIGDLPENSAWTRKTIAHSILHNFAAFMASSTRAIDYINRKGMRQLAMETKDAAWLVAKREQ